MQIHLTKHYRNIRGVYLEPGVHEVDATLGQYLIDNDHASVVDATPHIRLTQVDEPEIISTSDGVSATIELDVKFDREYYIAEYEAIYGRAVPSNISDATLQDRVENPPNDTPDTNG